MKGRVWAWFGWLTALLWAAGIARHVWAGNLPGVLTNGLFLLATLLILGALYSRSRRSMYDRG